MNQAKNNTVSVIIPAYNYGHYLAECLKSVLAQTYSNWECIIVDNGSTDHTAVVAEGYVKKDKRFKYHFMSQKGVSAARNKGVELSSGYYILPLDADDKIDPAYLQKAFDILEKDSTIHLVYCDAGLFGARAGKWILPNYSLKDLLIENSIFCTALYRKIDFEKAGGYDEDFKEGFEDWDFWIRMLKDGGNVFKIPEVLFYYRMRANSRNGVLYREQQLRLRRQIFEKHRDIYERTFSIPELIFEVYCIKVDQNSVRNSIDFKLGTWLLKPARFVKNLFRSGKK